MKRANQYNIKHNEFAPSVPPLDPKPPPQTILEYKNTDRKPKRPLLGKGDKATTSSLLDIYLQPDSTKEVSNRDKVSINALATKCVQEYNPSEHPISTLASLETNIIELEVPVELNANIATMQEPTMGEDQISDTGGKEITHEELVQGGIKEFERMELVKTGMFRPSINFVSEFQIDEEESMENESMPEETPLMMPNQILMKVVYVME